MQPLLNQSAPFEIHSMPGCGLEQHDPILWRTDLLLCYILYLYQYHFISWLSQLPCASSKQVCECKNVFQILNSVVPCGLWLYVHLAAVHWMPGSGMEQHHFIVWRTELLICQACASEEDVKAAWGCLFSNLDTSMSATSSGQAQFGSNVFFFCCCCPGTHGGHYFDNLRWAHSCGRRSVVPAESSCPAELQAALGFEANSGRGCLGIEFEADRNRIFFWSWKRLSEVLFQ